jgi:hypothetical protein
MMLTEMPEYRRKVSPASLVLPLVHHVSPASAFRHRRQSGTAGHGLIRQRPAMHLSAGILSHLKPRLTQVNLG